MPPGFAILDDQERNALLREAIDEVLTEATSNAKSAIAKALKSAIGFATEGDFDVLLGEALRERDWLTAAVRLDDEEAGRLRRRGGDLSRGARPRRERQPGGRRTSSSRSLLSKAELTRARDVLAARQRQRREGRRAAGRGAEGERRGRPHRLPGRMCSSRRQGEPRKSMVTKSLGAEHPDTETLLARARDRFVALHAERCRLVLLDAAVALLRLGNAVMQRYGEAKARRAALDFDDLIAAGLEPARHLGGRRVGAVQAGRRARPHPGRRGAGYQPRAVAGGALAGGGVLLRQRRARGDAHAVRGGRREAVDLRLPGRGAAHVRRRRQGVRRAGGPGRPGVAAGSAHAVVPHGGAAAAGGRPDLCRSGAGAGADVGGRDDPARRASLRPCRADRGLADGEAGDGRARRAVVAARRRERVLAGGAAGDAHRRRDPAIGWISKRASAVGRPADPRRRHSDPGAPARAVRAGDGVGAEGARHQGGGRRPADADRADRRAGPDGARRFHLPAGRRSGAGVACSSRRCSASTTIDLLALAPKRKGSLWQELLARAADNKRFRGGGRDAERLARAGRTRAAVRVLRRAAG